MNRSNTILFVSAYLSLITAAENKLRAAGYGVRCAHNISSAVRCLTSVPIDAVVLCGSPDGGVRRTISDHVKRCLGVPVVLLSPAKPNSIEELLHVLEATGEETGAKLHEGRHGMMRLRIVYISGSGQRLASGLRA